MTARARRATSALATLGMLIGLAAAFTAPAATAAQPSDPGPANFLPSDKPSAITPPVNDGRVFGIAQTGTTVVIGGSFTSVGGVKHDRVAAFNKNSGAAVPGFNADVNDDVNQVIPGPTPNTVFIGGAFTTVNGQTARFVAELDTTTGQLVPAFQPAYINFGPVDDLVLRGSSLYVAGKFTKVGYADHAGLVALDATTGALLPSVNLQFSGHHNDSGSGAQGTVGPTDMDVTADGKTMVIIGNFKYVNGLLRDQVALIDLSSGTAQLAPWATNRYSPYCFNWAFDMYVRGVAFSPDGSFFAVNATGGGNPGTLCDATARFDTNLNDTNAQPTWVAETGGDTAWGLTITNTAIYMGGHFRWENNPFGVDKAQPGAVPRPGMAALDVSTGRPYAWNPGHVPLGVSAFAFLATPDGVWMGSDFDYIGAHKYLRPKLAFFPYQGGYTAGSTATAALPATAYLAGNTKSSTANNVLYRVDAGGPAIPSLDSGPDWAADTTDPSPYRNTGSNAASYGPGATTTSAVPASTPNSIFNSERWSPSDNPAMKWAFPVPNHLQVQVRLYFANRCTCTSSAGQRVFTVKIDNTTVLNRYDIVRDVGDQKGTMKSFTITSDGTVNIDFSHNTENPLINGIEIVRPDLPPPGPLPNNLTKIAFDGTTAASAPADDQGIDFRNWRGAFMAGNEVYYGYSDGFWYSRTFDGTTFGPAVKIDPYHDPYWSPIQTGDGQTFVGASPSIYGQISNLTGMAYANGRVFYTLNGDSHLYARWFLPDSGIVDETTQTMTSSVNFSSATGMFIVGGTLYYGSADGVLRKVSIGSNGTVTGSPLSVSGPLIDGVNWFNRAMFLYAKQNIPPVASFTATCTGTACSVDASSSVDVDGSITSYAWDFGDGATASGPTASHDYGTSGTFSVVLSVTDDKGVTTSISKDVGVSTTPPVTFVAAAHASGGSVTKKSVVIPPTAAAGNVGLLFFAQTSTATWSAPSGTGWAAVGTYTQRTLVTKAYEKVLGAGDPGSTVTFTTSGGATHAAAQVLVYSNVDTDQPIENVQQSGENQSALHTSPVATAGTADYGVTFWAGRSTAARTWTAPSVLTTRDATPDTGTLTVQALAADSNSSIPAGSYGGYTATTDAATGYASSWTVVLRHAPPPNVPPVAGVSAGCTGMTCSFDASSSFDPDNGALTYTWDFGDGHTGSGLSPSHTYAAMGSYTARVTVTDNRGGSDSTTTDVTVPVVKFVDAADAPGGSAKAKQVTIPGDAVAGDTAVLFLTQTSTATWSDPTGITGWTTIDTFTTGTLTTTAWVKALTVDDVQGTVKFTTATSTHASLDVVIYRGVDAVNPVAAFARAGDANAMSHVSPTVSAPAGSLVVTYWGDRASATRTWTAPGGLPVRAVSSDTGSLTTQALVVDSGDVVPAGTVGGSTATTDGTTQATATWTIALIGV